MPIVGQFLGITLVIYYYESGEPHFRAKYADQSAVISILGKPKITKGMLPLRITLMVLDWTFRHQKELMENWELAAEKKPLNHIEGSVI